MKQIILPVTIHLNIRLPHALLQPESADAPTGPEPEAHACQGCGNCNMIDGVPNNTPIPPTPPELDAKPLDKVKEPKERRKGRELER